ncbi:MAG TPA: DNA gyrase inhibitor YacG [Pseudobdellovibrionaceae bacterium]|nr:DNA gyrase inhibitor YacG [Pseudobdellovibrionaceae bacterium]
MKCPRCGLLIFYDVSSPFRPFCSERCKLIDLGAWAEEKFRVPLEGQEFPENQAIDPYGDENTE